MLLYYLVKVETPKMYVDTTSAFNVNYKIAVACIKLYSQFRKMFYSVSQKKGCHPIHGYNFINS